MLDILTKVSEKDAASTTKCIGFSIQVYLQSTGPTPLREL